MRPYEIMFPPRRNHDRRPTRTGNHRQQTRFSELLADVIKRYQNRAIETAQVIEELIAMAKKFKEAIGRGEELGLNNDELAFYDALANNEEAVQLVLDQAETLSAEWG